MPAAIPLQDDWLGHMFGGDAATQPTQWWAELHYGNPGGYCLNNRWSAAGRKQITSWSAVVDGVVSNASQVQWLNVPDPGEDSQMSWVSVWTASIGGSPLAYARIGTPITVGTGDDLTLEAGALSISNVGPVDLGDVTGSVTVSFTTAQIVKMRLTGDVDLSGGMTEPSIAAVRYLIVEQDDTGGWGVTWPTLKGTRPMVNPIAEEVTVVPLVWDGANWHVLD